MNVDQMILRLLCSLANMTRPSMSVPMRKWRIYPIVRIQRSQSTHQLLSALRSPSVERSKASQSQPKLHSPWAQASLRQRWSGEGRDVATLFISLLSQLSLVLLHETCPSFPLSLGSSKLSPPSTALPTWTFRYRNWHHLGLDRLLWPLTEATKFTLSSMLHSTWS